MTKKSEHGQKGLLNAAKQMEIAMAPMIQNMMAITKSIQPSLKAIQSFQKNMVPTLKLIESWQKSFIPIFDKIDFEKLQEKAREMNTPAFKKFINEWGWLVNQKAVSFGDYCYGLYKKYGDNGFRDKISRWFYQKKNVRIVLKDIKSKFPDRYPVIKEGFDYHVRRNYVCSVTLLLPNTEGILWDLGMKKKLVRSGYNSKKKYTNYKNNPNDTDWELQELSKKLFPKDKFHNIIVKEIFCEGPRNKILHGRNIYNKNIREISRWKSTLLILTLWRLSDEF